MKPGKLICGILLAAALFSCGKKLPPPSPDVFPAKLVSGYYIPNSQIRIDFNENLYSSFDSAFCLIGGERISSEGYAQMKSVFINIAFEGKASFVDLYGVSDEKKNKRDYLNIPVKGEPQRDTIPPSLIKQVFTDSTILVEFSEDVLSCSLEVYPNYIPFTLQTAKGKVIVRFTDTLGFYPVQYFFERVTDKRGNSTKFFPEKRFADNLDTLSLVSLRIDSLPQYTNVFLLDSDSFIVCKKNSLLSSYVLFDNLKQGLYKAEWDSSSIETLLVK